MQQPRAATLVFHAGALGDFILTWPLAVALQHAYPDTDVTYITHPSKGELAARFLATSSSSADQNGWHTLYSDSPALAQPASDVLARAESCFCFTAAGEDVFCSNLRQLAPGVPVTILSALPEPTFIGHVTAFYAHQLAHSTIRPYYAEALKSIGQAGLPVTRGNSSRILLHPGAGSTKKCWPLECYLDLSADLRAAGHETAFLFGEAETERYPDQVLQSVRQAAPLKCPRTYVELAEELLDARLLITNDNGPGHLAGVLGGNVLSLFGPTNSTLWRPIGPGAHLMESEMLGAMPPSRVLQKALEIMGS